ncbi:MAG TPA: DUF1360 domain-containing protein [Thermoanaerobaculia bacterium]|nr:DUF1360 domain-containing protein [Thermoanaerobaculia bacterium]
MSERTLEEQLPGDPFEGYAPPAERPPLLSYAATMGTFNALFAAALLVAKRSGRELPERVDPADVVMVGAAAHKLSRLLTKEKVTAPLRAPFTELEGKGGPAELEERSRGEGARRVIGELLTCPFCLSLWIVAGFSLGLLFAPRLTRFLAAAFTALGIADFLQLAYKAAEDKALG